MSPRVLHYWAIAIRPAQSADCDLRYSMNAHDMEFSRIVIAFTLGVRKWLGGQSDSVEVFPAEPRPNARAEREMERAIMPKSDG